MNYSDLSDLLSDARLVRYLTATNYDQAKALDLYHFNIILSQQMFGLISLFEIVLRNKINNVMIKETGDKDWLLNSIQPKNPALGLKKYQGCFLQQQTQQSANLIFAALMGLGQNKNTYHADKLVAELGFGFWRYLFMSGKNAQYDATGKVLLRVFPKKPKSYPMKDTSGNPILNKEGKPVHFHYDNKWVFNELSKINKFRNRLAHHEPIYFDATGAKSTQYVRETHQRILDLMTYMDIDTTQLFHKFNSINHLVIPMCNSIDKL